jgi:heme-degrading monooxygenase HmoA
MVWSCNENDLSNMAALNESRECGCLRGIVYTEIFTNIAKQSIRGYHGIHLLRRDAEEGVEFVTIMWFENLNAVRAFAGEDYEVAVVPPKARQLLSRFDHLSSHYQVIEAPISDVSKI